MALSEIPVEHLGTLTASTNDIERLLVKGGPFGTRMTATVSGGKLVGPRINATIPEGSAAGDWLTLRADGSASLDVRLNLRTDDGADLYLTYTGVMTRTDDGVSIKTAPRFETGDERYAWLNNVFCVALGTTTEDGVSYEFYIA